MENNYTENNNGGNNGSAGLAIASMVLGIVAVVFSCCFYYISFPCGVVGLILGGISLFKHKGGRGMAIAGLILSIVAVALGVLAIAMGGAFLSSLGIGSFL